MPGGTVPNVGESSACALGAAVCEVSTPGEATGALLLWVESPPFVGETAVSMSGPAMTTTRDVTPFTVARFA